MSVLFRGINEGPYLAPKLCIEALSTLVEKLHNMDVKNSAMIVTGIYFAYCGLKGELRNKAGELLTAILGKPGQKIYSRNCASFSKALNEPYAIKFNFYKL